MRFFRVLPALGLLFGARASSLDSRHRNDVRDLLDVCASVNAQIAVPNLLGILTAVGVVDVCLCLSALPLFQQTNVVALLAVDIAGESVVTDILTNLILGKAPDSHCNYPDHSVPACIDGNPCRFTCTDGFTAFPLTKPTTCACLAPLVVRNGKCVGEDNGACPPPAGGLKKRSWVGSGVEMRREREG